jgi:PhnB protein
MQIQPYLFFDGRCDEALEFYKHAIGARILTLVRYRESPVPHDPGTGTPAPDGNKVMHASVRIGDSIISASDGHAQNHPEFRGFALSLTASTDDQVQRLYSALSEGGQVRMPLGKTFFSSQFGMLTDRFGVLWMIYVASQ